MHRSSRQEGTKWTAYPEFHQNELTSSGFLRVTITTYLRGGTKEWVETFTKKNGYLTARNCRTDHGGRPHLD